MRYYEVMSENHFLLDKSGEEIDAKSHVLQPDSRATFRMDPHPN